MGRVANGLCAAALAVCLVGACSGEGSESPQPPGGSAKAEEPSQPEARPSELATRLLTPRGIEAYREIGRELELDWVILASADVVEGRGDKNAPAPDRSRALAIGYVLSALSASVDYETALEERGGARYAKEVISLSQRFEARDDAIPRAELPFEPPPGELIAAYGQKFGILHDGLDIDAPPGQKLRAAGDGVVTHTEQHPVFGLYTCVSHRVTEAGKARPLTTCYGNQSEILVDPGDRVARGETIGRTGCTGTCLRPHVHFQVRDGSDENAPTVDPARFVPAATAQDAGSVGTPLESNP